MRIINAKNINHALDQGLVLLRQHGVVRESRNGRTLDAGCVATVYQNPRQNILTSVARKANHMFHFVDAMWVLAGRNDVETLFALNKQAAAYSDDGKTFFGSYGKRLNGQYFNCLSLLEQDPDTRRAAMAIYGWSDCGAVSKDIPCNLGVLFRVNDNKLDMTVTNRSNDIIWGLYGSNHVQFSMLHIAFAESLGCELGTYTHVSNSFHAYLDGPGGVTYKNVVDSHDKGEFDDQYFLADARIQSQARLFSTVGASSAQRFRQTQFEINAVLEQYDVTLGGPPNTFCRAAKLTWIAMVAYERVRKQDLVAALHELYEFQDEYGSCLWSKQFITQVKALRP